MGGVCEFTKDLPKRLVRPDRCRRRVADYLLGLLIQVLGFCDYSSRFFTFVPNFVTLSQCGMAVAAVSYPTDQGFDSTFAFCQLFVLL